MSIDANSPDFKIWFLENMQDILNNNPNSLVIVGIGDDGHQAVSYHTDINDLIAARDAIDDAVRMISKAIEETEEENADND